MSQDKKKIIATALKKVIPSDWKYSVGVQNHSRIVVNILAAPLDLIKLANSSDDSYAVKYGHLQINHHHLENYFKDSKLRSIFEKIVTVLNTDNYDRSDHYSDYFDVGHYISINIGKSDKPFVNTSK